MTLCVVWKIGEQIFQASDSRISNGKKYSDYGIKVIPVPVVIYSPSEANKEADVAFRTTYGMCFAGSFVGAYVVREFLIIALQKLQYVPTFSEISFNQVARMVFKFYRNIVDKVSDELDHDHSVDFFLSGYCPNEKRIVTAKFYIDYGDNFDRQDPKYFLIDDEDFVEFIGSGEDKYKCKLKHCSCVGKQTRPLVALKRLIESREVASVGGNIQLGSFNNDNEFSVSGIVDIEYQENGIEKIKYSYAGLNMNGDEFNSDGSDYFIMGSYFDPFNNLKP